MKVQAEVIIEKNTNDTWEVMGNQFAEVAKWSSNFFSSEAAGEMKFPGLNYSARVTETERGETIQELDAFDPTNHSLAYHITKGAPQPAQDNGSRWFLESVGENQTKAVFEFMLEPKPEIPAEMVAKIEMGLTMGANKIAEEFKHYVETGMPHPRKVEMSNAQN